MATLTHAGSPNSTSNTNSYTTGSFTPATNDWLVAFVIASETATAATMTDSQGLGFTLQHSVAIGVNTLYCFTANALASASAMTVTFDCTGDNATGAVISVARVAGGRWLRQIKSAIGSAGGTPAVTFDRNVTSGHAVIAVCANSSNPATLTPPTSYSEYTDTGYNTPTTGFEGTARASGETGATITWGGTSATDWGALAVEIYNDGDAITGSGASTEAGADTHAGTGTVAVTGSGASTESGNDVHAGTGAVAVTGSGASTETGNDTHTGTGAVAVSGSGESTETGEDGHAGAGAIAIAGSGTSTESSTDAHAGTGTVAVSGSGTSTETGNDIHTGSGGMLLSFLPANIQNPGLRPVARLGMTSRVADLGLRNLENKGLRRVA
jgi:fibronectin-binding autotransporter adhesin